MLKNFKICHEVTLLFLMFFVFSLIGNSSADTFKIDLNAAAKSEYNDNLNYTSGKGVDDVITTFSPGVKTSFTDAILFSELSGRADILKYKDNTDLDAVDNEFSGAIGYKLTPRLSMNANGNYIKSSRPDYYVAETGLTIPQEIERKIASFKTEYFLTEKVFTSFEYNHDKLQFKSEKYLLPTVQHEDGNPQYQKYTKPGTETNTGNIVIGSNLGGINSNLQARLTMGYSHSSFKGLELDSTTALVGLTKNLNEKWSVSVDAGVNNIKTDFASDFIVFNPFPTLVNMDNESLEWIAFSSLNYKGELSSLKLSLSRTVTPAPERFGAVERLSAGLSGSRRITEDLSIDASAVYYTNTSGKGQYSITDIDVDTVQLIPSVKYMINRYFSFEAAYKYTFIKNNVTNNDVTQNVVYCRFFAGYPVFE